MILNGRKIPARQIVLEFKHGMSVAYLAGKYSLAEHEIQEVLRRWLKQHGMRSENFHHKK